MVSNSGKRATSRGYRIGVVLAVIALVPLAGATWLGAGAAAEARSELATVGDVDAGVRELVALSELRTKLFDEQNWRIAEGAIAQIGLKPEVVVAMTGIDLAVQTEQAAMRVDQLVAELGLHDVAATLEDIRAHDELSIEVRGDRYQQLELTVGQWADERLDRAMAGAGQVHDPRELINGLRVLEAATVARQSMSIEFNNYFGAKFSPAAERANELTALVSGAARRDAALADIRRISPQSSATQAALSAIAASPEVREFDSAVSTYIAANIAGTSDADALTSRMSDIGQIASTFTSSSKANDSYQHLVTAANEEVNTASRAVRNQTERTNRQALATLALLAVASVAIAIAATRSISRPIRRLEMAARRILDGHTDGHLLVVSGPVEVREAANALNDAGASLQLAERQALALAEGDLEHESLRAPSTGALGASLQSAVQRLALSLQEREEFRRRMAYEATHDGLTQLPNRNASLAHLGRGLARTARSGKQLALLFIDLDGFKDINDHHGHHVGDNVLRVFAQRLANGVREGDHVGRLGGDEFLVIAEPVDGYEDALALAHRIRDALNAPMQTDSATFTIAASIGVALSGPEADDPTLLLRDADLAVYRAKELGRDRVQLCDDSLRAAMLERADLEQALRIAIDESQFVLYYQPVVEPISERTVGYEALIRWHRPGHGLVMPDAFIPFAERSDLIVQIDRWVAETVAHQIVIWDVEGVLGDVPVSINVSGRHLASPDFVTNIMGPIDALGIDPKRLIVEITESALLDDLPTTAAKLQHLRDRGIRTAIDDFGTGYTSLAHLKSLPIDILKIDRSFTIDSAAASLVQLIIDTGHLLGATVTAEGIETQTQADLLRSMGSDDLQGYLFGRPCPASEVGRKRYDPATPAGHTDGNGTSPSANR